MKKTKIVVGILAVILMTICSCTNEVTEINQQQLLKKIVEVSVDKSSKVTTLNYSGNKIQSIDKADSFLEFFYTGNEITKITEFDKVLKISNTLEYFYSKDKLVKIISSNNYVLNYIYNDDDTVSYEKLTKDAQNKDVKIHHGIMFFKNNNLIKNEQVLDNVDKNILSKITLNMEYDNKKNALHTILGFSKLLDHSRFISANNPVNSSETSSVKFIAEDRVLSAIKSNKSTATYDDLGYPVEIVSENNIFGKYDATLLKSQLFYN